MTFSSQPRKKKKACCEREGKPSSHPKHDLNKAKEMLIKIKEVINNNPQSIQKIAIILSLWLKKK